MIQYLKDNGKMISEKDMESQYGKMEPDMKEIGKMTYFMEMEHITLIHMIITKDHFTKDKLMVTVYLIPVMEVYLKANIKMVKKME